MTSVGVVQVASDRYRDWLVSWAQSVAALNRRPDLVVVVAESDLPDLAVPAVRVPAPGPFSWGGWLNAAVAACPTDWIVWVGVDDAYAPHALDGIDDCDADVLAFGMRYALGTWVEEPEAVTIGRAERNHVPVGSPFRRWLWQGIPFQLDLAPFEDWAFWASCARQGARFAHTGRIDFDYRWHLDTPQAGPADVEAVTAWANSLGWWSPPPDAQP